MNRILYEAGSFWEPSLLVPILVPVACLLCPKLMEKTAETSGKQYSAEQLENARTMGLIGAVLSMLFLLIAFLFQFDMYQKVTKAYQSGNYLTTEGYVENFVPMPEGGHSRESFRINGVYFEYSDYNITSGYRNTKSHGGVITGNGQYLKIGYIYYNETYGNIIVYIEELSPPED